MNKIKFEIQLGQTQDGKVVKRDIKVLKNLLIVGGVGAGKTEFLQNTILTLLSKNSTNNVNVIIFDPKQVEYTSFDKIPNCSVVTGEKKTQLFLELFKNNIKLAEENKYSNTIISSKSTILIIDEIVDVLADQQMRECVEEIFENGYKFNIFPIYATYNTNCLTERIKNSFNSLISFDVKNDLLEIDKIELENLSLNNFESVFYQKRQKAIVMKAGSCKNFQIAEQIVAKAKRKLIFWQQLDILKDKNFQNAVYEAIKLNEISIKIIRNKVNCGYSLAKKYVDYMEDFGFVSGESEDLSRKVFVSKKEFDEILKQLDT